VTDPRLAWFAIGATCSAVLFGWPWHPRSRRHRGSNPPPPGRKPTPSACPPVLGTARWFINNPAMYAECGGPCEAGPEHCDCGQVRLAKGSIIPRGTRSISYPDPGPDRQPTNPFTGDPVKPQPHGGRVIRGDTP